MSSREVTEHMDLWTDSPARTRFPRPLRPVRIITARPATAITEPRSPWYATVEANVRFEVNRLDCGQRVNVEGVIVRRTSAHNRLEYFIDGDSKRYQLKAVIEAVIATARTRDPEAV